MLAIDLNEIAGDEQWFKESIAQDVAKAVGGDPSKVRIISLVAGSIRVLMALDEGICGDGRGALDVANDLQQQAADLNSPLMSGGITGANIGANVMIAQVPLTSGQTTSAIERPMTISSKTATPVCRSSKLSNVPMGRGLSEANSTEDVSKQVAKAEVMMSKAPVLVEGLDQKVKMLQVVLKAVQHQLHAALKAAQHQHPPVSSPRGEAEGVCNNEMDLRLPIECDRYGSEQVNPLEKALFEVKIFERQPVAESIRESMYSSHLEVELKTCKISNAKFKARTAIFEQKHAIRVIELEGARVCRRSLTESVVKRNLSDTGQAQARERTTGSKMVLRCANRALSAVLRGWVEHAVVSTGIKKDAQQNSAADETISAVQGPCLLEWQGRGAPAQAGSAAGDGAEDADRSPEQVQQVMGDLGGDCRRSQEASSLRQQGAAEMEDPDGGKDVCGMVAA